MQDIAHILAELWGGIPILGKLLDPSESTKERLKIGILIALVPGLLWGTIGGIIQLYVFKENMERTQMAVKKDVKELRQDVRAMDEEHSRERRQIRSEAEAAQEMARDIKTDVEVIRRILENQNDFGKRLENWRSRQERGGQ